MRQVNTGSVGVVSPALSAQREQLEPCLVTQHAGETPAVPVNKLNFAQP
ncbi:MAG TPA: hypothetical protein VN951_09760 [Pyrinomonadaceae bacterium]|nr:hypothetical protein [Pyrinomonadaceae bacterium]